MNSSTSRIASYLAAALVIGGVTGCGGGEGESSDPRGQALKTVHAYQDASIDRDATALCAMFTRAKKQEVIAGTALIDGASGCEASVKKVMDLEGADDLPKRRASRKATNASNITIKSPATAVVTFPSGKTLPLVKVGDDWLIDAPAT